MKTLHGYIVKKHVAPFFFAFSVIMFILVLKLMLDLMNVLLTKGVGVVVLGKLLVYNFAWMIALVVPMSVLVATVMAFGSMGASGEIVAMKAAGISLYRVILTVFLLGVLITYGMIWFNNEVLPEANHRAKSLTQAVAFTKPMLSLQNREGQFVTEEEIPFTFHIKDINEATEEFHGVLLFQNERTEDTRLVIIAQKGHFVPGADRLVLELENGEIHRTDLSQPARYIRTGFRHFTYTISDIQFGMDTTYQSSRNDRTMTTPMMEEEIERLREVNISLQNSIASLPDDDPSRETQAATMRRHIESNRERIASYMVEIHKKNSIPVAAVIFVLIGAALGSLVRQSGASIGIGLSIGYFTLYYLFLIGGESLGDRMILQPWLAMWLPNIVLGTFSILLFVHAARR